MSGPTVELVSLIAPASLEADQYRALRHGIERLHRDAGLQVLGITSPGAAEGKTITTLNLAGSLAQSPRTRVLVVNADLHRPSVGRYLGIDQEPAAVGLVEAIENPDLSPLEPIRRLEPLNLSILLSGRYRSGAYELLNSARLGVLLREWRRHFDYIVIDTPPLVPLPDCRLLGQWVDGFVIVVAAHKTPRRVYAEALTLIDSAKILGTVFNGDDRPLSPYSSYDAYYPAPAPPERLPRTVTGWFARALGSGRASSHR
jgi:capsular exopolysaccharide synthesis family protein